MHSNNLSSFSLEASFRSDLRVANVNFINQDSQRVPKRNNTVWNPTLSSTTLSNTTLSNTTISSTSTTPSTSSKENGAVKSEIYKMHNNGLMLLHPQRPHSGSDAKKSELVNSPVASSINYHVRKRIKENETESTVADNEHFLESKLGDLPQIQGDREVNSTEQYLAKLDSENKQQQQTQQQYTLDRSAKKSSIDCSKASPLCVSVNETIAAKKWKSVVQGESSNGGEIKRLNIYPKNKRSQFKNHDTTMNDDSYYHNKKRVFHKAITDGSGKHKTLFRALRSMVTDDPLFDEDQPEETIKRYSEKRRLLKLRQKLGKLYGRGGANTDIPAIPPIQNIQSRIEKLEPLEHIPRFSDFGLAADNWPRFGVPELEMMHYPRFPLPKLDDFELIPGIPHIRQLDKGSEVTGDKRGFPVKDDEFVDEELDGEIRANTAPTPIPDLTDIPALTDIPDIPTIKPAPANRMGGSSTTGGVNGKMPVMQTVDTKDGKETRISA